MNLREGLEILVEDWADLHEDGGTSLSVEQVVGKLNIADKKALTREKNPAQMSELILDCLRRTPGAVENAKKFMEQFESAEDLLEEMDLDCLVSDLSTQG